LREPFEQYDAWKKFDIVAKETPKHSACICDRVLRGIAQPDNCTLFGAACTQKHPIGPCMVSHEGACRIWNQYNVHLRQ
jgi:hydrogenase expression/formation protein HypD